MSTARRIILCALIAFTPFLYAELPPYVYEDYKKNASEKLRIKVVNVEQKSIFLSETKVTVKAEVQHVYRSQSKLKRGDEIIILYTRPLSFPQGWVGPSPLPLLKKDQSYKAYLTKTKHDEYYAPAAKGKSFE